MKNGKILGLICILTVLLAGTVLAGGSQEAASSDEPKVTIILGHGSPDNSFANEGANLLKKLAAERSAGKIVIDNYPAFQLGNIMELDQNVKGGSIQMVMGTIGGMMSRKLSALDLPSTFNDMDAARKVLSEGEFIKMVDDVLAESNLKLMSGVIPVGYREVSSNKEIRTADDLKGLKIRTMEHPLHMAYWKALGANPTPIAFSELYVGLQQGLVEAQENPFDTILSSKIYEQQKYIVLTHHVMFCSGYVMNLDFYNSLPAEYQQILKDVFVEVDKYVYENSIRVNAESLAKLQAEGLEVIEFSDADYAKMAEAAKPVIEMVRKDSGDLMVDTLLKELAEASSK